MWALKRSVSWYNETKTIASKNKTKQPHQFRMTIQKKFASLFEKELKSTICIEIETTQLHPNHLNSTHCSI